MRDLHDQSDTIEVLRPSPDKVTLLEVDESGDDLPLLAVVVHLIQQLHPDLAQSVTGAGGDDALAGRGRCGPGRTCGDLVWGRNGVIICILKIN